MAKPSEPQSLSISERLDTPLFWRVTLGHALLAAIVLASLGLHLYNIGSIGDANSYYTAAVESMLQSWHNFFFAAAEPGGSVTVDKPPLGLWIQAASAFFLGVSGFSVVLPSIIAGLLSIILLFHLVQKYFGAPAGLIAALALAVTPVALAADRNNTADSLLTFVLLLAAWAFIKATESGKLPYLLAGAVLVGLGFNIKMLQAYLVLPALYALYLFSAPPGWGRKLLNLGLATMLLLAVSLSWAVVVDLWPEDQRPYVGSSEDNTVMELIFGHNGLNRLWGGGGGSRGAAIVANLSPDQDDAAAGQFAPPNDGGRNVQPPAESGPGTRPQAGPPNGDGPQGRDGGQGGDGGPAGTGAPGGQGGGGAFSFETGEAGLTRFFEAPLAKEMSWLLPFALLGLGLAVSSAPFRFPLTSRAHKAALLWGGWLVTCLVFFSAAEFFHAYYMVMLAPALGALVGIGATRLWRLAQRRRPLALSLLAGASLATMAFQFYLASAFSVSAWWLALPWLLFAVSMMLLLASLRSAARWTRWGLPAFALALTAMLIVPAAWSGLTVGDDGASVGLPAAYSGGQSNPRGQMDGQRNVDEGMLAYLEANTQGMTYLMAVPSSHQGASYVLETGRGVLYMGGFGGGDPVVDTDDLAHLVADGQLRYVLSNGQGGQGHQSGVSAWLQSSCSVVAEYSQRSVANLYGDDGGTPNAAPPNGAPPNGVVNQGANTLYDCAN